MATNPKPPPVEVKLSPAEAQLHQMRQVAFNRALMAVGELFDHLNYLAEAAESGHPVAIQQLQMLDQALQRARAAPSKIIRVQRGQVMS